MNRRSFLRLSSLVASASVLAACRPVYRAIGGPVEVLEPGEGPILPPAVYAALNRLTFGGRQSEQLRVGEIGLAGWIEEQLSPEGIDDAPLDWRLRPFDIFEMSTDDLYNHGNRLLGAFDSGPILADLSAVTLLRQVYSHRQLFERMAEFWTDHFNISMDKEDVWYLKPVDDRDVIRPHAMGNFRDLLRASTRSPAMLTYLDNQANEALAPNENYARELMELHTLGVDGGYSQTDVMELARCLTGWTVKDTFWRGEFEFNPDFHDSGVKTVLGMQVEPGGMEEAEGVIDRLAEHPSTARFLALKLARRFLSDDPPAEIVARAADAFVKTRGDIRSVLRVILLDGFSTDGAVIQPKFRRPTDFIAAALRMLNAETDGRGGGGDPGEFARTLSTLGQPPFQWPTPDGPPDTTADWMGNLMPRWQFAVRLARGEIEGTSIDESLLAGSSAGTPLETTIDSLSTRLTGSPLPAGAAADFAAALRHEGAGDDADSARVVIAGVLASPAFQWK